MTEQERATSDLTDDHWAMVEPLIGVMPRGADGRGRPWRGSRTVVNAIFWRLRTGARWADLPKRCPPRQTCERRFQSWLWDGMWEQIIDALPQDAWPIHCPSTGVAIRQFDDLMYVPYYWLSASDYDGWLERTDRWVAGVLELAHVIPLARADRPTSRLPVYAPLGLAAFMDCAWASAQHGATAGVWLLCRPILDDLAAVRGGWASRDARAAWIKSFETLVRIVRANAESIWDQGERRRAELETAQRQERGTLSGPQGEESEG
jgi:transposase